ncbi:hypothetical protein GCM10023153_03910 [Ornithinibacter aureus]|uniref:Transmembrane protein n=1 Tax=Ornithinibacter aureus TaxID=622664 RepID=A0ABP8JCH1_9MICO|nr:hypothetical protein [Ornithinibacter aureus]KAF0832648.1 hypothetical protein C8E84_0402 [Ornithinibacter aureus]
MSDTVDDRRTVVTLSVGARVGATIALLLLVAAGYLFWSPIQLYPSEGFPIMCGSGARIPGDDLGAVACGKVNEIRQWQAGSLAVAALVVAAGSLYAFGTHRRDESLIGTDAPGEDAAQN